MKKSTNKKRPIRKTLLFIISAVLAMAFLPSAALAAPILAVPFDEYTFTTGATKDWEVPLSNMALTPKMDIMYVIDTTGSMRDARDRLVGTISDFSDLLITNGATDVYSGVAFYKDWEVDGVLNWYGITLPLGDNDSATVSASLAALVINGGGDEPEDSVWAYMKVIDETPWRDDATHVIVIITDATTKVHPDQTVGSDPAYPVTLAGAALMTNDYDITPVIMSYSDATLTARPLNVFATELLANEYLWRTQDQLKNALDVAIIPPLSAMQSYLCKAEIRSITYASDGTVSTDVIASVTPASFTLDPGDTNKFDLSATPVTTPARYGDTTVVEVVFYLTTLNGQVIATETQYLYFEVEQIVLPISPLPATGDSGAMLLIATLLTALVGTSLFFAGRREQLKER